MKLLVTYALVDDIFPEIGLAVSRDHLPTPPTAETAVFLKLHRGRRKSRGVEIELTLPERDFLLALSAERIDRARGQMKTEPGYWRPLLAAWRALQSKLINDWSPADTQADRNAA